MFDTTGHLNNEFKTQKGNNMIVWGITLLLAVLKIGGVLPISWFLVFVPILATLAVAVFGFTLMGFGLYLQEKRKESK